MESKKQEKSMELDDKVVFQFIKIQTIFWQVFLSKHECSQKLAIRMLVVLVAAVCNFVDKETMSLFMRYFTENLKSALEAGFDNENEKMNEDGTQG